MGLPIEVNNLMLGSLGGYTVGRSLRFRSSASAYLNRTPSSTGNRQKFTWSGWVKRGLLTTGTYYQLFGAGGASSNEGLFFDTTAGGLYLTVDGPTTAIVTSAVFRDPSAWYHIVASVDTTQATASNRMIIYINGVQQTSYSGSYCAQNTNFTYINVGSTQHRMGAHTNSGYYFDGYMAEVNFIDGQQLTPSSFGAYDTNGVWQPKKYSGTYGTNGFYLPFSNTTSTTTLVQDSSGNGNNWTPNNISLTAGVTYDSMIDSPTNSASSSNYCVLNPLDKNSNIALSDGNLTAIPSSTADYWLARATMQLPSSGKWYWELTLNNTPYLYQAGIYSANRPTNGAISATGNEYQVAWGTAYTYIQYQSNNAAFAAWGTNTNPTSGNVLMFAVDSDNATMWIGRNGTWYNTSGTANPATNTDPRFSSIPSGLFAGVNLPNPASGGVSMNFGQRPFSYTLPSGFKALNTYNLPAPSIANGAQYMAATTYSGTSATQNVSNAVNGVSFQPDFAWIKVRSTAAYHALVDSLRVGTGGLAILSSNATDAEWTSNLSNYVTGFNSNGIALGNQALTAFYVNRSGDTYVGWQWKGGGTGVTNTSGSITSTVSANTTAGFSVVTYTGTGANATVGHGLGVAPSMIIIKNRQAANSWVVYHVSTGNGNVLLLNSTNASTADSTAWNTTTPTSSVFSLGSGAAADTNQTTGGGQHVAYCFAAVRGYSAFGSYTGNGSTDGPFCYTGFRPRWVMIKNSSVVSNWFIFDTSRDTYNIVSAQLQPNTSAAEQSGGVLDVLSNGFKLRDTTASVNGNGNTITFAAFAENPFNISRAR